MKGVIFFRNSLKVSAVTVKRNDIVDSMFWKTQENKPEPACSLVNLNVNSFMKITSYTAVHVSLSIHGEHSWCHQSRLDRNHCCTIRFQINNMKSYFGIRHFNNQLISTLGVVSSDYTSLLLIGQVLDTLMFIKQLGDIR